MRSLLPSCITLFDAAHFHRYPDNSDVFKVRAAEDSTLQGSFVTEAEAAEIMGYASYNRGDKHGHEGDDYNGDSYKDDSYDGDSYRSGIYYDWPECAGFCKVGTCMLERKKPICCRVPEADAGKAASDNTALPASSSYDGKGRVYCWRGLPLAASG